MVKTDGTLHEILKELGLRKVGDNEYEGVLSTGDFHGCHDYNAGLLKVVICLPDYGDFVNSYVVGIFTIDDGYWLGYSRDGMFDIVDLVENFTKTFGTKLPSESYLNGFLSKYNIYGYNAS